MSNAPKYRKKAVEYEQLKQFDRAVASYVRAIEENENAGEEVDVALFNKVGDLTLRQGRVTEAVTYYERAVEHYVSNSLFDNAIALCNKILRNAPGRSNVYFTLGRICGRKGLRSDATRNFLEYATRMQQEGRVDEGMRALAEVADLMPELTEVRRLVEEHAARAGISLTRRRETPTRAPVQAESEQVRSFGLSKDLVFLEIDYDAVRANREKTPPPQPLIAAEPPKSVVVADVVPATVVAAAPSVRLEDLMIFDPRNSGNGPASTDDSPEAVVVDGASILKPYVDPATPVVSLPDLEPTVLGDAPFTATATPAETTPAEVNSAAETLVVAARTTPQHPTPVAVLTPHAVAQIPANVSGEIVALDGVESGIASQLYSERLNESFTDDSSSVDAFAYVAADAESVVETRSEIAATPDTVVEVAFVAAVTPIESVAESIVPPVVDVAEDNFDSSVANSVSMDAAHDSAAIAQHEVAAIVATTIAPDADFEIPDFVSASVIAVAAVEIDEIATNESLDIVADVAVNENSAPVDLTSVATVDAGVHDVVLDTLPVESLIEIGTPSIELDWVAADVGNLSDEQAFDELLSTSMLDGFTADEEPMVPAELPLLEPIDELIVLDVEVKAEADVVPSLDFDAMLVFSSPEVETVIETVDDFEAEEIALSHHAFDDAHVADFDETSDPALLDAFESDNELPPLIFPLAEQNGESVVDIAPIDIVDETPIEFVDAAPLDFVDTAPLDFVDTAPVDFVEVTPISFANETPIDFVPATAELVFLDVAGEEPIALTPIALEIVEPETVEDDLDDLFGDTGIPTAVVAAEATLVASSRCAELQSASDADPRNFVLRRRLAEALFESGNRDAAINELGAALAGAELAGALTDAADIADELVRVASDEVAHHQKRLELAIRLGDQVRLRIAYLDLADNLVRRGEDLRAKAVYARVLEMDPWDERARTALGDAAPPPPAKAVAAGGSDDGHVSLADWLRDDDEPVSTRLRMREPDVSGDEQDDFNALLKHFKEGVARSLGEDDYESHYDLGVAYKEMGLLDDAIGEFQKALRSRNNRLAAYEALGQCFLEQQSYKVAVTVLSRALHEPAIQDEQRVGILYLLGYSCEVLQRFDEARGYFQRVYATDIHFRDVSQRLADLERTVR